VSDRRDSRALVLGAELFLNAGRWHKAACSRAAARSSPSEAGEYAEAIALALAMAAELEKSNRTAAAMPAFRRG
jgi:hypothetical protein